MADPGREQDIKGQEEPDTPEGGITKRKLDVDLDERAMALQTDSYQLRHHLDLETGEVMGCEQQVRGWNQTELARPETCCVS